MTCTGPPPDQKGGDNGDSDLPSPKKNTESDKETRNVDSDHPPPKEETRDGEW